MFTIIKQYIEQQNRPSDQEAARCAGRTNGIGFLPAVNGQASGSAHRSGRAGIVCYIAASQRFAREIYEGPDAPVPQNSERIR